MTNRQATRTFALALALAASAAGAVRASADTGGAKETLASYPLTTLDGTNVTLSSYRGQVVVVNFWASWCAPCRKELPVLDAWNTQWATRGARVVAISIDKEQRYAQRFVDDEKLSLTVLHDGPAGLAKALDLPSLPCTYILDAGGNVVGVVKNSSTAGLASIQSKVETLMAANPSRPPQEAGMGSPSGVVPPANDGGDR
jgi:thiol-disulfide isomerase/thioredoxin